MKEVNEELPTFDSVLTKTTTLENHLAWQLSMVTLADSERVLGELIVGNLSDDGYLMANLEDMAKEANVELEDAEEILKIIQTWEIIFSGNQQEAVLTNVFIVIGAAVSTPRSDASQVT
jgi:DNA-directed RNA polymerase specialized sigma54-like protein